MGFEVTPRRCHAMLRTDCALLVWSSRQCAGLYQPAGSQVACRLLMPDPAQREIVNTCVG